MALITGVLADYERKALANSSVNRHPVVEFHPSGPGVKSVGGAVFASRVISVTPALSTGEWEVDLELTTLISPEVWYEVVITWLDDGGNFISVDRLPGRLYVDSPGEFTAKYRTVPAPWEVWIAPNADPNDPSNPVSASDWMYDPITNDLSLVRRSA